MHCLLYIFLPVLIACGGENKPKLHDKDSIKQGARIDIPQPSGQQCYHYFGPADTIIFQMNWLDSSRFKGSLVYRLKEKDQNIGTLKGEKRGVLLLAEYRFQSEGKNSIREVAFKKVDNYLLEGSGEVKVDSNATRFVDLEKLSFDVKRKLVFTKCL